LPSGPTTGDLVMVRKPDGVVGTIEAGYAVVAPPAAASPAAWSAWGAAAVTAAVAEIQLWAANAEFLESHCTVNGPLATGTKGVLTTRDDFDGQIRDALLDAGAPAHVAEGWDRAMAEAWNGWADNATVVALPWYPSFLAYPAAEAYPVANVPTPLAGLISTGAPGMAAPALSQRIEDEIGADAGTTDAGYALAAFANEIGLRFLTFVATRQVMDVMGSGPVPSYNPSIGVLAGPVVGTCSGYPVLVGGDF
ncbi:MAG TPA: hypothetical protein VM778_14950, partial [Gemmatimonadota bacterium]|nr:hypothetical protein [Gemmatimonadota bacterium]